MGKISPVTQFYAHIYTHIYTYIEINGITLPSLTLSIYITVLLSFFVSIYTVISVFNSYVGVHCTSKSTLFNGTPT